MGACPDFGLEVAAKAVPSRVHWGKPEMNLSAPAAVVREEGLCWEDGSIDIYIPREHKP